MEIVGLESKKTPQVFEGHQDSKTQLLEEGFHLGRQVWHQEQVRLGQEVGSHVYQVSWQTSQIPLGSQKAPQVPQGHYHPKTQVLDQIFQETFEVEQ